MSKPRRAPLSARAAAPASTACAFSLQRTCGCGRTQAFGFECESCSREAAGRAHGDGRTAPPIVHEVLRSAGEPLDPLTRAYMEPRFGHDFSRIRLHTDPTAARSAQAVDAHAYTVGSHVVFGRGQYAPSTAVGRRTLAHELTHVMQQEAVTRSHPSVLHVGPARDANESEADRAAAIVGSGGSLGRTPAAAAESVLQRLSIGSSALRFFGIESGEFSDEELTEYLDRVVKNMQCDCGTLDFLSDDKARAIIGKDGVGTWRLDQDYKGMSSVDVRRILIQELLAGPTGEVDERAIIKIFNKADPADVLTLLDPSKGLSINEIVTDVDGDNHAELSRVLNEKQPTLAAGLVTRSETPGAKSGACTATRAVAIHFAFEEAKRAVANALELINKSRQSPSLFKQVGGVIDCFFKDATDADVDRIVTDLNQIAKALARLNLICPADPFTGFRTHSKRGDTTELPPEPGLLARALVEGDDPAAPAGGAPVADKDVMPLKVALYPEFFDLSPLAQTSVLVHEAFHHAKKQGDAKDETYNPKCGALDKGAAFDNADSYAKLVMRLRNDALQIEFTDCPPQWKAELVSCAQTAQLWIRGAVSKLDALSAAGTPDPRVAFQLKRHFKIEPKATSDLMRVRKRFAEIEAALSGELPFECETNCDSEDTVAYTGGFLGISPRGGSIHFCPRWFQVSERDERVVTIVHEMAHRYAGRGEEAWQRYTPRPYAGMTADQAYDNADSYAQFARNVRDGGTTPP
ncbi:hypothetical protein ACVWYQ_006397 [Bradyrhizobium sp. USDA 3397]